MNQLLSSLLRTNRLKRTLWVPTSRKISDEGVTSLESEFEQEFADAVEPLLADLYDAALPSMDESLPDDQESIAGILFLLLMSSSAAAALLALLQEMLLKAFNIGGALALEEMGLVGDFDLTDEGLIDQINGYAGELLELLVTTTANDLGKKVEDGRDEGLSVAAVVAGLSGFILLRSAFRADIIAASEMVAGSRWGMEETYRKNGILFVEFRTQRDSRVDAGDPLMICTQQDGRIFEIHDIPQEAKIPLHIRCRCFYVPVLDGWVVPDVVWFG